MANKKSFSKQLRPYLTTQNIIVFSAGLLVFLILVLVFVRRFNTNSQAVISEDQILLQRNGETITINANGLIEYKSGDTTTYRLWSADRVSNFFANIKSKARQYLENPNLSTSGCIQVTLYLDGELVSVCINEDDDVIQEAFDEFEEVVEDDTITLEDLFDSDDDNDNTTQPTVPPEQISTFFDQVSPTPTYVYIPPENIDNDDNPPIKADCLDWESDIVGDRAIISNTLCSIQRIEPEE